MRVTEPEHIPSAGAAMRTIPGELDRAYEAQMILVDLIAGVQSGGYELNHAKLREVVARRLRESVARRDAAVRALERDWI